MRIKYAQLVTIFIIISNVLIVYFTWKYFLKINPEQKDPILPVTQKSTKPKDKIQTANKHIKKSVTLIFRDFYHFETDLKNSIDGILNLIPSVQIFVIYDEIPYPPLEFFSNSSLSIKNNVKFINLNFDVTKKAKDLHPISSIKTKYVLFMPDSVRLSGRTIIQKMIREFGNTNAETQKVLIIPFNSNVKSISNCCGINLDFSNWTIEYSVLNGTKNCDMFLQKHAIMVETSLLKEMPDALSAPFPEMFYLQAQIAETQKIFLNITLQDGKRLFTAYHTKQRRTEIRKQQFKEMYKKLQLKRVIRKLYKIPNPPPKQHKKHESLKRQLEHRDNAIELFPDSLNPSSNLSLPPVTEIVYYGCEKNTPSCIGQVYSGKPSFIYQNKHTPPCCLEKLKTVFHHVVEEFENVGIRYWIDNSALKTAIETNQLSSDAFEIDISFNVFDLNRSGSLKKSQTRPFNDEESFYWIKATDGQYFRVQYSKLNQIGVNLLPFELNGKRVKPSGFYGWKAKEFSTEFLHPMSTVLFLGKNVMCPNNVREFLEMKKPLNKI